MHASVVFFGAIVMLTATVAPADSRSCETYQLDAKQDSVAIADSIFEIENAGPGSVEVTPAGAVYPPNKSTPNLFFGDAAYSYSLVLVDKSQPTEVTICID